MAIIIPSNKIYSKSFDPIVDNEITGIELETNEATINYDTQTVFNQQYEDFADIDTGNTVQSFKGYQGSTWIADQGILNSAVIGALVIISEVQYSIVITAKIEENQENQLITNLITGLSKATGEPNILYTIYGDYSKGKLDGNTVWLKGQGDDISLVYSYPHGIIDNDQETSHESNVSYSLEGKTSVNYSASANFSDGTHTVTAHAEVSLGSFTYASPIKVIIDNKEYWRIQFDIIAGLRLNTATISKIGLTYSGPDNTFEAPITEGIYETYTPKRIEVSINGNVLKLDLKSGTSKIGNGNKVFSFEGNELIQTTNVPSIESKYQSIIDKWKNGKQTAVIRCAIADYYSEDKEEVTTNYNAQISITKVTNLTLGYDVEFQSTKKIQFGDNQYITLYCHTGNNELSDFSINVKKQDGNTYKGRIDFTIIKPQTKQYNGFYSSTTMQNIKAISISGDNLPMTFHEGDIVIPYKYTNYGDKPLLYNKDFTPKQLKVVGTRILKKGLMQELTLLEV